MAMRGKHRDVIETRRREKRRADVRHKRLSLAVGIGQLIVGGVDAIATVLAALGLL